MFVQNAKNLVVQSLVDTNTINHLPQRLQNEKESALLSKNILWLIMGAGFENLTHSLLSQKGAQFIAD